MSPKYSRNNSNNNEWWADIIYKYPPIIGMSISGGGYRSMLIGAGFLKQLNDDNIFNTLSYISGLSGGSWLLTDLILNDFQVNNLLANWNLNDSLIGGIKELNLKENEIISIEKRSFENDIMKQEDNSVFTKFKEYFLKYILDNGKTNKGSKEENDIFKKAQELLKFYIHIHESVIPKKFLGFDISFTDYWSKVLIERISSEFLRTKNSSSLSQMIANSTGFQKFQFPLPIFISNGRNNNVKNIIFEFTPFEFGSWELPVQKFFNIKYIGSKFINGKSVKCVCGFDDIGFISATSSSVFNNILIYFWETISTISTEFIFATNIMLDVFGLKPDYNTLENGNEPSNIDLNLYTNTHLPIKLPINTYYAIIKPNPFYQLRKNDETIGDNPTKNKNISQVAQETNEYVDKDHIYLVDGGEDGENIPLRSLIQPERKLDTIIVLDSSSDSNNYPNASKLCTINRQLKEKLGVEYLIPQVDEFIQMPEKKPVLIIGCEFYFQDSKKRSKLYRKVSPKYREKENSHKPRLPLLLYFTNSHQTFEANTSTFKVQYSQKEVDGMLANGRAILTSNYNHKSDIKFKQCLGCFFLSGSLYRSPEVTKLPYFCSQCYKRYCYASQ
ncbi:hypothetical protein TBLA_0D04400 [Henningerozyma blattae CBS 6284]|uniref:Lysophospholipase n=1 Tax=Henningerozyma blattae (strain ATCC 34711 / CBS 6284 / DSM 70876 / NBRC 10599 / NRRL Y-10934 / UCD 77-7) TaxID=1071380 RepID=I2H3I4_HENB6|nr:hypothetical protein TBLA_0D04400 [Tetrapisispora blattae CBS 6284]CCH60936.1 hypothetical protein TBLA_0D04400 [Tetrapisispora blattae CBS 6284]